MEVLPLVFLLLNLLCNNSAAVPLGTRTLLTIHPQDPLVEVGSSIQLLCSMDCPGGKVQWEGLDTDLADVISNNTSSILTVSNAAVRMGGMKICTGQCGRASFQKTVELQVYSLPDTLQLVSHPEVPRAGQPAHLLCLASHVYTPDTFKLTWFQGDDQVEEDMEDFEEEDMEDSDLLTYHSKLGIPVAAEHTTYRCEATLQVGQRRFHRSRMVTVHVQAAQDGPTTTNATFSQTAITTSRSEAPERPTTAAHWNSSSEANTGHLPPPLPSTEHPTFLTLASVSTASPVLEFLTSPTTVKNPATESLSPAHLPLGEARTVSSMPQDGSPSTNEINTTWTLIPVEETAAMSGVTSKAIPTKDQPSDTELASTTDSLPEGSAPMKRSQNHVTAQAPTVEGPCRPAIRLFPPQGTVGETLRITCHAVGCHGDVQIRWQETPVALSQFHQEEVAGLATLTVNSVREEHQGVYRCIVMTSPRQMASLRVVVTTATFGTNTIISIGATGSLLGLIATSYVSHRLWQRHGS